MINIRHAIISDVRAIAKIHVCSWQKIYRGIMPDQILDNISIDEREKLWKSLLETNTSILVLEENNNIIGFISFCPCRDEDVDPKVVAEISALYLNPDKWRLGYGTLLSHAAVAELKQYGFKEVILWVVENNHQARHFYEKMGFINTQHIKTEEMEGLILSEIRYNFVYY